MDITKIPKGRYCHVSSDLNKVCPYWTYDTKHTEEHENGFCLYLNKGDWDLNEENGMITLDTYNKEGILLRRNKVNAHDFQFSLLWDQVKACNANH